MPVHAYHTHKLDSSTIFFLIYFTKTSRVRARIVQMFIRQYIPFALLVSAEKVRKKKNVRRFRSIDDPRDCSFFYRRNGYFEKPLRHSVELTVVT